MEIKKSNIKILSEGRFIRLLVKDGWEYIQRTNCTGIAVMVAVTEAKEILLVEQYRPPVDCNVIELPAGLINDGAGAGQESGEEAAGRELLEETGYAASRWIRIFSGPGGPGASSDILHFYLSLDVKKIAAGGGDATEIGRAHV